MQWNLIELRHPTFVNLLKVEGQVYLSYFRNARKHEVSRDRYAKCVGMCQCILNEVSFVGRTCPSCVEEQIPYGTLQIIGTLYGTANNQQQTTSMIHMSSSSTLLLHPL